MGSTQDQLKDEIGYWKEKWRHANFQKQIQTLKKEKNELQKQFNIFRNYFITQKEIYDDNKEFYKKLSEKIKLQNIELNTISRKYEQAQINLTALERIHKGFQSNFVCDCNCPNYHEGGFCDMGNQEVCMLKKKINDLVKDKLSFKANETEIQSQLNSRNNLIILLRARIDELTKQKYQNIKQHKKNITYYQDKIKDVEYELSQAKYDIDSHETLIHKYEGLVKKLKNCPNCKRGKIIHKISVDTMINKETIDLYLKYCANKCKYFPNKSSQGEEDNWQLDE